MSSVVIWCMYLCTCREGAARMGCPHSKFVHVESTVNDRRHCGRIVPRWEWPDTECWKPQTQSQPANRHNLNDCATPGCPASREWRRPPLIGNPSCGCSFMQRDHCCPLCHSVRPSRSHASSAVSALFVLFHPPRLICSQSLCRNHLLRHQTYCTCTCGGTSVLYM